MILSFFFLYINTTHFRILCFNAVPSPSKIHVLPFWICAKKIENAKHNNELVLD